MLGGRDSGLRVCSGCGMSIITVGITGLSENLDQVDEIKSGAPNDNFRKISVRKTICDLQFSEHLL